MNFALSHEVRLNISELLKDQWFPGRFETCFHVHIEFTKRGAFGTVYKALCLTPPHGYSDMELRDVAVKEIELRYVSDYKTLTQHSRRSKSLSKDSQLSHQFLAACQESVIQKEQESNPLLHPNIAKCYTSWIESPTENRSPNLIDDLLDVVNSRNTDIGRLKNAMKATHGLKFYIVMDYYTYNLMELLQKAENGAVAITKLNLIDAFIQVSDALAHIHQQGYIHRDIKPQNILVSVGEDGQLTAAIGDFGLCRKVDTTIDLPRAGTPVYCDYPEEHSSTASDMWAFGVTLFETFTMFKSIRKEQSLTRMRLQCLSDVIEKAKTHSDSSVKNIIGNAVGGCNSYRKLKHVIHSCLRINPLLRLQAEDVGPELGQNLAVPATVQTV